MPATRTNHTMSSVQQALTKGTLTSVELVENLFTHIKERNEEIGAFLTLFEEQAKKEAQASDQRRKEGALLGPLDGIPLALKDNLLYKETKTTASSKILESYDASYTATAVQKLVDAGAIIIGKTNLDEFAMGASTENAGLGKTTNPHDTTRVPGGSSGGSAAAVADSQVLGALGTDTGGSIRQPAAFTGIVGFKPTYGAVSRSGAIAMASSLDQIGPLTKTVKDAGILFHTIAGQDKLDVTSSGHVFTKELNATTGKKKIGIPKEYLIDGLDPRVEKAFQETKERFEKLGHEVVEISLPHTKYALSCYYIIVPAEVSSNVARYDGIRYAKMEGVEGELLDHYLKQRGKGFGKEVKRRIILGTYVLSSGYYDAYYGKAQTVRSLITKDFEEAFKEVDLIIAPVTPTPAFKIGAKSDPLSMYLSDIFTIPANLAGLPALSLPVIPWKKQENKELPINFQIMGPRLGDNEVLELGLQYEEE